jgi:hypothetical protein
MKIGFSDFELDTPERILVEMGRLPAGTVAFLETDIQEHTGEFTPDEMRAFGNTLARWAAQPMIPRKEVNAVTRFCFRLVKFAGWEGAR